MGKIGIVKKARTLRREYTEAEKILWEELRGYKLGIKWRRQHPMDMYILDFYCPKVDLCIELDGSPHKIKENKDYDDQRETYLKNRGIKTIRFWNSEVDKNLGEVLEKIREETYTRLIV